MSTIITRDIPQGALAPYENLTRRQLAAQDRFIAESVPVIEAALEAGLTPLSLLCEQRHVEGKAAQLISRLGDVPVYAPPDEEIRALTGYELFRGVLCEMQRPRALSLDEALGGARSCAVLEDVSDETNLGAIFRSAAALGVGAVLLTPGAGDPYSRRSARVSMGAVFRVPFARIGEISEGGALALSDRGFTLCALALDESSAPIDGFSCSRPAILLGNEGRGLRPETLRCCPEHLIIPMHHGMDSLNVSAAAAVAFWELVGKRQKP